MRFLTPLALALLPFTTLALDIDTPPDVTKGQPLDLTWTLDPENIVFYLTDTHFKSYAPIAFAPTDDGRVTAQVPDVAYDTGFIVAYSNDGHGPLGTTQQITLRSS